MKDRVPTKPGRVKLTRTNGTSEYATLERADEPTQTGTPINKATLFSSANEERFGCELPSEAFGLIGKEWTVTIPQSGWSTTQTNGYYTNRVTVSGMKAVYNPIVALKITSADVSVEEKVAFGAIDKVETYDGYIILYASTIPDSTINLRLKGV